MDIISLINTDKLYWLGRYSERVYTTIRLFSASFDTLIDMNNRVYDDFCKALAIPNIYSSAEDFVERYLFDPDNPDSVLSNLTRAYDNAVTLREEIGSECLSYIQLALYAMNRAHGDQAPLMQLQKVVDNILAFWGLVDDMIEDENTRNIIKTGKRVERLDLYARLHRPMADMKREVHRLSVRIKRTNLRYHEDHLDKLAEQLEKPEIGYEEMVSLVDTLVII